MENMATKKESKLKVKKSFLDVEFKKEGILVTLFRLMSNKREITKSHLFTSAFLAKLSKLSLGDWESAKSLLSPEIKSFWKNSQRSEFNGWTRERDIHNSIVRSLHRLDLAYYYGKYSQVHNDKRLQIVEDFKTPKEFISSQVAK